MVDSLDRPTAPPGPVRTDRTDAREATRVDAAASECHAQPTFVNQGEMFFRGLLDTMSDGVYLVDRSRTITYWSRGAERLTGFAAADVVGKRCRDGILDHCDDAGLGLCGTRCPLKATMADGRPREARMWMHHADGHRQPVWVRGAPLRDETTGAIVGAVETFSDDHAMVAVREQLAQAQLRSMTDALTGVGNRRLLDEQLEAGLDGLSRHGHPLGLLFVDLDRFKAINDRYGHDVGDDVLRMVARTLTYASRPGDTVTRAGGEEFALLLPHTDGPGLTSCAERLRALVGQSRIYAQREHVAVTISIGATFADRSDTRDSLLRRADTLLYEAKRAGRNQVRHDVGVRGEGQPAD